MAKTYPQRSESHQMEELSERFFRNSIPHNWRAEKVESDYGVDLRVDIFEGEEATGLELLVQLKSSRAEDHHDYVRIKLKTTTYNYLWDKLQVVILVKFIESENEAYWLLLKDVPEPNQDHRTFTIRIPKRNKLSTINWDETQEYVKSITSKKLAAARRDHIIASLLREFRR